MRALDAGLEAHLRTGATTLCRCWRLARRDGVVLGFTDHDRDLAFADTLFRAESGMTASALQAATGLSVDNAEAIGALSDAGLDAADIRAGRWDGAEVRAWLVNWADVAQRLELFRGTLGEIRQEDGLFRAELRGLTEPLNQPRGRAYQRRCSAVLGDGACGVDLAQPGYRAEVPAPGGADRRFVLEGLQDYADRWFRDGVLRVLDGPAAGLSALIREDRLKDGVHAVELWEPLPVVPAAGDRLQLEAGCDKRAETCRLKFHNFLNFRGFPTIPGEDWALSYPVPGGANDGGRLR